jgi:hypothetical protein
MTIINVFQSHDQNIVVLVEGNVSLYQKNVLKIVLIIVNINKNENQSLISNQSSLKNDPPPHTSWRTILQR